MHLVCLFKIGLREVAVPEVTPRHLPSVAPKLLKGITSRPQASKDIKPLVASGSSRSFLNEMCPEIPQRTADEPPQLAVSMKRNSSSNPHT